MPDIIAPPKTMKVTFSLEPALNAVNSLELLNAVEQFSGFDEWVYRTAAALTPEQMHTNRLVRVLEPWVDVVEKAWPSFTAWLDDLASRDPYALRDHMMDLLCENAAEMLGEEVPAPEQLLADRGVYLSLIERTLCCKENEEAYPRELYEEAHALLNDPPAMLELAVTYSRMMWDDILAPEWEHSLPMLKESIAAFQTLDFTGMSCSETVRRVTGRDLDAECDKWQETVSRLVFIPSAHLGPYVAKMVLDEEVKILFGARVPEGVTARSPELSRSELLMRLNALADETRLSILELLADEGGLSSQEIMERLDLSQSAASRHLRQLAATGYLSVERRDGAKAYRLNRTRIDDTFGALKKSVK
jgi:DNA-binding transcriptional ArsR family regulator